MAGIRVDTPVGDDWEYSMDTTTWQESPVFNQQPDGNPFVLGTIYTVYCRNQAQNLLALSTIPFGDANNDLSGGRTTLDALSMATPELVNLSQYEADGVTVVVFTPFGPIFRRMAFERLAQYVVDRMAVAWQNLLLERLLRNAPDGLIQIICDRLTAIKCGGGSTPPTPPTLPPPTATILGHYELVTVVVTAPQPTVNAVVGRYDPDRGFLALANCSNGDRWAAQLLGVAPTPWSETAYRPGVRFEGTTAQGSYVAVPYNYVPDGEYEEIWQPDPNTDPARAKTKRHVIRHTYAGSVDVNDCFQITGWAGDLLHINRPPEVDYFVDGVWKQRQTCQVQRTDVRDNYFRPTGYTGPAATFGFAFVKSGDERDGLPHTHEVRVVNDPTEFTYNQPKTTTCAAPTGPGPFVTDYEPSGLTSLNEGGDSNDYHLIAVYNDGSRERYNQPVLTQVANLPGLTRTTIDGGSGCRLQLAAGSISANQNVALDFILGNGIRRSMTVQLVNADLTRPTGLTTYQASFNFTRNNTTRKYTTLDDANEVACKHFANIEPGNLNLFSFQAASLNNNEVCYVGTGVNTATLSNEIYYVTDASGANTVLLAIQIVDGKILVRKANPNNCAAPPPANRAPVRVNPTGNRSLVAGETFLYTFPANVFSDPDGDALTYALTAEDQNAPTLSYGPLPSWCNFDPTTRQLSGTVPNQAGLHIGLRLSASDGRGGVAHDYFAITTPAPPAGPTPFIQSVQYRRNGGGGNGGSSTNPGQIEVRVQAIGSNVPKMHFDQVAGYNAYPTDFSTLSARSNMPPYTHYNILVDTTPGDGNQPFAVSVGPLSSDNDQVNFTVDNITAVDANWTTVYTRP